MSPSRTPKSKPGDKLDAPPTRVQGYYTTPYGRFMSVTTLLEGGLAAPELQFWYAKETAQRAIDNIPKLARLRGFEAREEARKWLAKAAVEKRDEAAARGTWVHDVAELKVLGAPWPEPDEEKAPFVEAVDRFLADHAPEFEATELTVANPADGWAGTCDGWARLPRTVYGNTLVILDYKTSKSARSKTAMQLAAYQRATVGWLKDGTEVEPPRAEHAVLVHLRPDAYPDTGYAIYPLDTSDAVYAAFLSVRDVALNWTKGLAKTALGEPLELILPTTEEVA